MKIHVCSDLHLEYGGVSHRIPDECDVVVLAGDIGSGFLSLPWIEKKILGEGKRAVMVAGNHEFYTQGKGKRFIDDHYSDLFEKCLARGIDFLQDSSLEMDGIRFLGCTMWTDFNLHRCRDRSMRTAHDGMNDYEWILGSRLMGDGSYRLDPTEILERNFDSVVFLERKLREPFEGKTIVVTHHAPLGESIDPRQVRDPLAPAYASELVQFFGQDHSPDLWIHGHTHHPVDYTRDDTRVLSNPYRRHGKDRHPRFDDSLVLEV